MNNIDFNKQTAFRIRQLLEERQITQRDLAKVLGKSQTTICNILAGRRKSPIRHEYLEQIADYFGVPVDYLVTDESNTDAMLYGCAPRTEEKPYGEVELYRDMYEETKAEVNELKDQIKAYEEKLTQTEESREYYFNLANSLVTEKNSLKDARDVDVEGIKDACLKQMKVTLVMTKAMIEILETL